MRPLVSALIAFAILLPSVADVVLAREQTISVSRGSIERLFGIDRIDGSGCAGGGDAGTGPLKKGGKASQRPAKRNR